MEQELRFLRKKVQSLEQCIQHVTGKVDFLVEELYKIRTDQINEKRRDLENQQEAWGMLIDRYEAFQSKKTSSLSQKSAVVVKSGLSESRSSNAKRPVERPSKQAKREIDQEVLSDREDAQSFGEQSPDEIQIKEELPLCEDQLPQGMEMDIDGFLNDATGNWFEGEVTGTIDQVDGGGSKKRRRRRNRRIDTDAKYVKLSPMRKEYILTDTFTNWEDAVTAVKSECAWSLHMTRLILDGKKQTYRCKYAERRKCICTVGIYLLHRKDDPTKIELYRSTGKHTHPFTTELENQQHQHEHPRPWNETTEALIVTLFNAGTTNPTEILTQLKANPEYSEQIQAEENDITRDEVANFLLQKGLIS